MTDGEKQIYKAVSIRKCIDNISMHSAALPRVFARARLQASTLMQHEEAERNTHSSYCERKIHSHAQHCEGGARVSLAVVADEDLPRVAHKRLWCAALSITRTRGVAEN